MGDPLEKFDILANRWRGENVSTLEVEATISNVLELKDATAYGVEIPNVEGRAGMTTILIKARNASAYLQTFPLSSNSL